jgi:hypothetical protein
MRAAQACVRGQRQHASRGRVFATLIVDQISSVAQQRLSRLSSRLVARRSQLGRVLSVWIHDAFIVTIEIRVCCAAVCLSMCYLRAIQLSFVLIL